MKNIHTILCVILLSTGIAAATESSAGQQATEANFRISNSIKVKRLIDHRQGKLQKHIQKSKKLGRKSLHTKTITPRRNFGPRIQDTQTTVLAHIIENPPVDGFIPWISVVTTKARGEDGDPVTVPQPSITGQYTTADPAGNWALGIFDTGASAHVMGFDSSVTLGVSGDMLTDNITIVSGVTGAVDAWVSQPLGLFITGLQDIGQDSRLTTMTNMIGETNVAIAVGTFDTDLPTAIGSPLSVYYTTCIYNDQPVTIQYNGSDVNAPTIVFYENEDPAAPDMPFQIPLELRPLGALNVAYIPDTDFDISDPYWFPPASPSILNGINPTQSLFFVPSVDLYNGTYSAIDKGRFMLDTGAQVTVIGSRIAARLGLDPSDPDFDVEIQGVDGQIEIRPGFYIEQLDIPALGSWISLTNIPVVYLDIQSPEGGTLDGIIGMNLFLNFNLKLQGGGIFLTPDPFLAYEPSAIPADIAPDPLDHKVDALDLDLLASHFLETDEDTTFDPSCDFNADGHIDLLDYAFLAQYWMENNNP